MTFATTSTGTTQEDQVRGHNFRDVALVAVFIVIAAVLNAAFDVNLLAFREVGGDVFRAPEHDVVPVGLFLPLTRLLVLPSASGGDRERSLGYAGWREFRFGILAEVAEEDRFINAACHIKSTVAQGR